MVRGPGVHVPEILLAVRVALAVATVLILFIPAVRTAAGPSTNMLRLTLLPVSRRVLHFADLLTGLTDPWIALLVPAMILFPLGILASGRVLTGLIALAAGTVLVLLFLALSPRCPACSPCSTATGAEERSSRSSCSSRSP
jgi:hypothetical protein